MPASMSAISDIVTRCRGLLSTGHHLLFFSISFGAVPGRCAGLHVRHWRAAGHVELCWHQHVYRTTSGTVRPPTWPRTLAASQGGYGVCDRTQRVMSLVFGRGRERSTSSDIVKIFAVINRHCMTVVFLSLLTQVLFLNTIWNPIHSAHDTRW